MPTRFECVLTNDKLDETLFTFTNFPILCSQDVETEEYEYQDMNWRISPAGVIQLGNLIPLNKLYSKSHTPGTVGKIWESHHKEFGNFLMKYNPKKVVEFGAGHGILAKTVTSSYDNIEWLMIEMNLPSWRHERVRMIEGDFMNYIESEVNGNMIVHSHTFEHLYDPAEFLRKISGQVDDGTYHICSIPDMENWLRKGSLNTLFFEHTVFMTEKFIETIFGMYGFQLIEKQKFHSGHSIFYAFIKNKNYNFKYDYNEYHQNKQIFEDYISQLKENIQFVSQRIRDKEDVYIFGGHIFSQYLLNMGIDRKKIKGILDNDTNKHNKYLYGTGLLIESPKKVLQKNVTVIVIAGLYTKEIIEGLYKINPNIDIISKEL